MIQIESLAIQDFRGIRRLKLKPARKNFGICGPNGTGKSGVVDAIEFALTGNITRLTGQGTSGISLRSHAPHVDGRKRPEKSRVELTVFLPSLKKKAVIERHVGDPGRPIVTPADEDVLGVIAELGRHPEFALSRREIIKYVITPPGARSKEVQAHSIEQLRQSLKKIENYCTREMTRFDADVRQTQLQLKSALGIPQLKKDDILAAVNQRRRLLDLEPISELRRDTSLVDGILSPDRTSNVAPRIPKKQALKEMDRIIELLSGSEPREITDGREAAAATLKMVLGNPDLMRNLERQDFLRSGRDLIDDDVCPLCDTAWDPEALRSHITAKLATAYEATALRNSVEVALAPFANILRELESLAGSLLAASKRLLASNDVGVIEDWLGSLAKQREQLTGIRDIERIANDISKRFPLGNKRALDAITDLRKRVEALPEPSNEEEAKHYLTICNERLDVYRLARRNYESWVQRVRLAAQLLSIYNEISNAALNRIYKDVEQDFGRFYRFINREDEATFEGRLIPSLGKLGFDVDFYGRGFFPPGAYHSEGHQDGMGLCLYLALMRHTLREQFTFAVLDDVLMSVDTGHRREVCALLKLEFGQTQFIFTTHDPVWLQHMKTEQLITAKSSVQFHKWTVDLGPIVWEDREVWDEIDRDLNDNKVSGAAGTLRRFFEYVATHLCNELRASIEFHGDAQYDLGELLPAAVQAWRRLLASSHDSAQSWGRKEEMGQIAVRQEEFNRVAEQTRAEQWAINRSIHYNEWATLRAQDFSPVVDAFKRLLQCFRCLTCGTFFYVTPKKGQQEGIRCDCGAVNFNLKKRH